MHPPASLLLSAALAAAVFASACSSVGRGVQFMSRGLAPLMQTPRVPARPASASLPGARLAVTWVGHASVLIQLEDKFILTDPSFRPTVGQVSKRLVEPGLLPEQLPRLDAVIVSHMHFDHLSQGSLEDIGARAQRLFVPEGGLVYVPASHEFPAIELRQGQTWAESDEPGALRISAVPAKHVGHRYALERDWLPHAYTGYVVQYKGLTVFFGGDTAYEPGLQTETARRFPGIDLALLPIGPIEPRDFMRRVHTDSAEALALFAELGAARLMPIHFDTFINSLDAPDTARKAFERAWGASGLTESRKVFLQVGEQRRLL